MFIFLYGPDDYRRIQKKREIIAEFERKHSGLGLGFFDLAADGAMDALTEFARNQFIFDSAKLAVTENAFEMEPAALAKLLKPLAAAKDTAILIAEKEKPTKALAFLLEKPSLSQRFENLEGVEWLAFIKAAAKQAGITLADAALRFLAAVHQGNSWALVTELQKLAALRTRAGKAGSAAAIEGKDLDALDLEAAPNYWALLNGLKSYDAKTRLFALERLFAMNDPAAKIFNILAAQAGEKIPRMAEYDRAVKSGKLDYEEVLLDLAIS
jgi:DNA polymerase III delta subunit